MMDKHEAIDRENPAKKAIHSQSMLGKEAARRRHQLCKAPIKDRCSKSPDGAGLPLRTRMKIDAR